jgi:hypothetical protein
MTPQKIKDALSNFNGSETFTKWSILFSNCVLTEGALFVAEQCGAYWLMDAIASHQHNPTVRAEGFQVWKLAKDGKEWLLSCEDGNDGVVTFQKIQFSDFPLENMEIWAVENELGGFTLMLPSEY